MNSNFVAATLLLLVASVVPELRAAGVGKIVARSAMRRLAAKSVGRKAVSQAAAAGSVAARKSMKSLLKLDRLRDSKAAVKELTQPRTVYRFTTKGQAQVYLERGVPSGTHFTAKAGPGRPLSAARAKERLGLPRIPTVRVEAVLPKGTTVKSGKVVGGMPGYGELKTYRRPLPKSAIKSVLQLQK